MWLLEVHSGCRSDWVEDADLVDTAECRYPNINNGAGRQNRTLRLVDVPPGI